MEIRELSAKQVAECIENYQPLYEKSVKRNRRNAVLVFVGLLLVYLYLRLFNTGVSIVEGKYGDRVTYSTAWVVNYRTDSEDASHYWLGFDNCPYMRVLNVEEGVTGIHFDGYSESKSSNYLHTVRLPSTLQEVGVECFKNCTNLKAVEWDKAPEGAVIGWEAFWNTGIEELKLPDGITYIGRGAFKDNPNLRKVVLPDSVRDMEYEVFENCGNLQEVTWSASLTYMPYQTFLGCENLSVLNNTGVLKSINYDALIGTQITADQLPENVHCYKASGEGVIMNTNDVLWLTDYSYTYNAEEETKLLAKIYDIPQEAFELKMMDGQFWLNGEYYSLNMTIDEFVEKGDWTIDEIYESKEGFPTYYLEREADGTQVSLSVNDGEIMEYHFYADDCRVILPDGVNNFGMLNARIPYLYREEAASGYDWKYAEGGQQKRVSVTVGFSWLSEGGCTITISKTE